MGESKRKVAAIAAMAQGRVIGYQNQIPWKIPADMKHFAALTMGHSVLMGRLTYESLPEKFRPLPNRRNIVISRNPDKLNLPADVFCSGDPSGFIEAWKSGESELGSDLLWVIGGEQIYCKTQPLWDEVYITLVRGDYQGDAFFPEFESSFTLEQTEDFDGYSFLRYRRKSS